MKFTRSALYGVYEKILGKDLVSSLGQYGPAYLFPIAIEKLWGDRIALSFVEENILRMAYDDLQSPGYFQFDEE